MDAGVTTDNDGGPLNVGVFRLAEPMPWQPKYRRVVGEGGAVDEALAAEAEAVLGGMRELLATLPEARVVADGQNV